MTRLEISIAAVFTLIPFFAEAFFAGCLRKFAQSLPKPTRLLAPAVLAVPYALVASAYGIFHWSWFLLYASIPVGISILLWQAQQVDSHQRGNWRDLLVLTVLGLAVDLRWMEPAWPARLSLFGKLLLLDAGIYAFLAVRQMEGVGFDLRLRFRDLAFGLREFLFYTPLAIPIGLELGFLHLHPHWPQFRPIALAFFFTFFFIAIPEELFFRGWLQNLLERRFGRLPALFITAALFGLSHWNKRAAHFNWRYVALATLAGIFYGRAWRQESRVGAAAITHASVDTIWSLWLR
jgi:membrane protease YdiL (CAAX protease family)